MGSLRNPIGPLPSSIYWRRRAVALSLVALLVLLVIWAVGLGGDGGGKDDAKGPSGGDTASTITPGPSSSGPVNDQRPGGRDESDDEKETGGTGGSGDSGGSGGTGGSGGNAGGGPGGSGGNGTIGAAGGLGVGNGALEPSDSTLADCEAGTVELTLRSLKNSYEPGDKPKFELAVKNSGDGACKVDLGCASASLTITDAADDHVWVSDDCPSGNATSMVRVPGDDAIKRTVDWDRKITHENCASPSGVQAAPAGTYLVEAKVDGLGTARVSFVLAKD